MAESAEEKSAAFLFDEAVTEFQLQREESTGVSAPVPAIEGEIRMQVDANKQVRFVNGSDVILGPFEMGALSLTKAIDPNDAARQVLTLGPLSQALLPRAFNASMSLRAGIGKRIMIHPYNQSMTGVIAPSSSDGSFNPLKQAFFPSSSSSSVKPAPSSTSLPPVPPRRNDMAPIASYL